MALLLLKPITRRLVGTFGIGRFESSRPLNVTLEPGDVIMFREHGRRTTYEVSLHDCFKLAVAKSLHHNYKEAMLEYNRKKKAGCSRLRKPRKPAMHMFNDLIRKAIS